MGKMSKKMVKRPRADKHKGKKSDQRALDRSGDGTLKQGQGRRSKKSSPWRKTPGAGESSSNQEATLSLPEPTSSPAAAPASKSKQELVQEAIKEKIRKRDDADKEGQSVQSKAEVLGRVPDKRLIEILDVRLKSRILYCNPVCLLTTVVPRAVREKAMKEGAQTVEGGAQEPEEADTRDSIGMPQSQQEKKETLDTQEASIAMPASEDAQEVAQETRLQQQPAQLLDDSASARNVMVLSWLTPTNNEGAFICAIHKRRFSAECLQVRGHFALSVPVQGMETLVLKVGDVTGRSSDKARVIDGLSYVSLGSYQGASLQERAGKKPRRPEGAGAGAAGAAGAAGGRSNPFAALEDEGGHVLSERELQERALAGDEAGVAGCVAHLVQILTQKALVECRVVSMAESGDAKHHIVSAQIMRAWVHPDYWNSKHFIPTECNLPALLSFIGASRFAYVR